MENAKSAAALVRIAVALEKIARILEREYPEVPELDFTGMMVSKEARPRADRDSSGL